MPVLGAGMASVDDEPTIIIPIDHEAVADFDAKVSNRQLACLACAIPHCWILLPCNCMFLASGLNDKNTRELAFAKSVELTRDGVRYRIARHKTGCRFDFQDVGATTATIGYDKIVDVEVTEPAGASGPICCLVPNVLTSCRLMTANDSKAEFDLRGLRDPHAFKNAVLRLKRGEPFASVAADFGVSASSDALMFTKLEVPRVSMPITDYTNLPHNKIAPHPNDAEMVELMRHQVQLLQSMDVSLRSIDASLKAQAR